MLTDKMILERLNETIADQAEERKKDTIRYAMVKKVEKETGIELISSSWDIWQSRFDIKRSDLQRLRICLGRLTVKSKEVPAN